VRLWSSHMASLRRRPQSRLSLSEVLDRPIGLPVLCGPAISQLIPPIFFICLVRSHVFASFYDGNTDKYVLLARACLGKKRLSGTNGAMAGYQCLRCVPLFSPLVSSPLTFLFCVASLFLICPLDSLSLFDLRIFVDIRIVTLWV